MLIRFIHLSIGPFRFPARFHVQFIYAHRLIVKGDCFGKRVRFDPDIFILIRESVCLIFSFGHAPHIFIVLMTVMIPSLHNLLVCKLNTGFVVVVALVIEVITLTICPASLVYLVS